MTIVRNAVAALCLALLLSSAPAQTKPPAPINANLKDRLAVQLWSFREDFKRDVPGTLKRVHDLGFTYVELAGTYGMSAREFRRELDKASLKAVSMHIEYKDAQRRIDHVIQEARTLGVQYVGVPWIKSPFTQRDCLDAIAVFNRAGEKLAAAGMHFFYHLHGYEFVPDEKGKGTLFDLLASRTDRTVSFQLDTYHVAFPGQDPVALMRKYPTRFTSLHLKDLRRGAVGDHSGEFREKDEVPIGLGKLNWPDIFQASREQMIRWYIIEDETADVWKTIPASLGYLFGSR